jgi:hypothetical protein
LTGASEQPSVATVPTCPKRPWFLPLAAVVGITPVAHANGRFPRADQLVATPGQPGQLVLRTTFGLLVSRDAGSSWEWICEEAIGFARQEDPAVAMLAGGRLLAGLSAGLAHATGSFCSWQFAPLSDAPLELVDLTVRPLEPASAVALAWERTDANGFGYRSSFFRTDDAGATWQSYGSGIDPSVLVLTVDVAPSDPRRLYASGIRPAARSAALFVSTDDALTWAERAAPFESPREQGLYIAAVDPLAPERVYLRSSGADSSRLLVTDDAGLGFDEIFSGRSLLGFALSPDGSEIYVGGPEDGLWWASRDERSFEQRSSLPIQCLLSLSNLLYACSNEQRGFALGVSSDGGRQFTAKLHLSEVRGPIACGSDTSVGVCPAAWPAIAERLGIDPEAVSAPSAGGGAEGAPASSAGRCAVGSAPDAGSSCLQRVLSLSLGVAFVFRRTVARRTVARRA